MHGNGTNRLQNEPGPQDTQERHHLRRGQPQPAGRLGHRRGEPAQFGHLGPVRGRLANRRGEHFVTLRQFVAIRDKPLRRLFQQQRFLVR